MKVFVSGQVKDYEYVREVQNLLEEAGHTITHDWTQSETGSGFMTAADKQENPNEASRRAVADLDGVMECEAYIICTSNEVAGKGMYVELGAALAMAKYGNLAHIYLIGDMNHSTIFYSHPLIQHARSLEDLLKQLSTGKTKLQEK